LSEKDELWYVRLSLRTHVNNDLAVQTFCNQCGELVLQELSEKTCARCQSPDWASANVSGIYRQMLIKLQEDNEFRNRLKITYKETWNKKFPKYNIPEPGKIGRLVPSKDK